MRLAEWLRGVLSPGDGSNAGSQNAGSQTGAVSHAGVRVEVPDLAAAWTEILSEFQRARRYERTVTVAVATLDGHGNGHRHGNGRGNGHGAREGMPVAFAAALRQAIRETDLVAWDSGTRRCVIVMPEIGVAEGRRAMNRMRAVCESGLGCAFRAQVAQFPSDGWTFEELLSAASEGRVAADGIEETHAERPAANEPRQVAMEVTSGE